MIPMLQQDPRFRPVARVTHLHTPTRFLQAWRGLLLPGPIPGVAKVHHRSLPPSQRLSLDPAVAPPTPVVPVQTGTSHPCPLPRHSSGGWNPGKDEGSDDRKWNEMEQNGTELKVCRFWPLVTRPLQSKQGHACPPRTSERSAKRGQPRPNGSKTQTPRRSLQGGGIPSPSGRGSG